MDRASQLIWEAYAESWTDTTPEPPDLAKQKSYFDSWQLPDGCEDWRLKYKTELGIISMTASDVHNLMMHGCKPMGTFLTNDEADMISDLQQKGFYVQDELVEPGADWAENSLTFVGKDPEWVKKGIEAWRAQLGLKDPKSTIEFGKALGFGEHSFDIGHPEIQGKMKARRDKEKADQARGNYSSFGARLAAIASGEEPYDPPEL